MPNLPTPSTAVLRFLRRQCAGSTPPNGRTAPTRSTPPSAQHPRHPIPCPSRRAFATTPGPRQNDLHHQKYLCTPFQGPPLPPPPASARDAQRLFSTTHRVAGLWKQIWGSRTRHADAMLAARGLPPLATFLDDNTTPGRALMSGNELRLRCTEFDGKGDVTLVNGELKKSELIAKYGLLPRDLRKIDSSLLPSVLVRPSAILINLLHLRVLIKHNRVLVFDAYGSTDSYTQSVFMYDLEGKLRQANNKPADLPYEFRALEAVLVSVTTGLESEFEGVREPVVRVLRELEEDIDRDKLRYLLIYSKKLGTFEQKARLVRNALDQLLEADDDLAAMYLTEKAAGKERSLDEHEEVELLLESYHKVTDEIVNAAENLVSNIRNTEEIVKAILDANRNSLMLLDLRFSIWTLGLTAGTLLAALYGMNLKNFIEDSDFGFVGASAVCAMASVAAISFGIKKLRKVQRVSMWDQQSCPTSWNTSGSFWDKNPKKEIASPLGLTGLRRGSAGRVKVEESTGRHDYWIGRRREHMHERGNIVGAGEEMRKEETKKRNDGGKQGGGGTFPDGGYC